MSVNDRLHEIANKVDDEKLSLDETLDLYEEAVALGMEATKTVEENVAKQFMQEDDE